MVAQYLPTLCRALGDSSPLIRRQTLTLLTRLLTEDFVKLREELLFSLVLMMADDEPSVRQLGWSQGNAPLFQELTDSDFQPYTV